MYRSDDHGERPSLLQRGDREHLIAIHSASIILHFVLHPDGERLLDKYNIIIQLYQFEFKLLFSKYNSWNFQFTHTTEQGLIYHFVFFAQMNKYLSIFVYKLYYTLAHFVVYFYIKLF